MVSVDAIVCVGGLCRWSPYIVSVDAMVCIDGGLCRGHGLCRWSM